MTARKPRSFAAEVWINILFVPLTILTTLVSVPLFIDQIGLERYGILTLIWALTGMFAFFDFGMGAATAYFVARARARGGAAGPTVGSIMVTTATLNLGIGLALAVAFWAGLGALVLGSIEAEAAVMQEVDGALTPIALLLPVALATSVLRNAIEGQRRFLTVNVIGTGGTIATVVATLAVAFAVGPTLEALVMAVLVVRLCVLALFLLTILRDLRGARFLTGPDLRALLGFGGWQAVFAGTSGPVASAERFIIGWISGAAAAGLYAIPSNLMTRLMVLPHALVRTLYPRLSEVTVDAERRVLAVRATMGLLAAMAALTIPVTLVIRPFFEVWIGPELRDSAGLIGQILLMTINLKAGLRCLFVFQRASGRPDLPARLRLVSSPLRIALIVALVWSLGAVGAAVALLAVFAAEFLWMIHKSAVTAQLLPMVLGTLALSGAAIAVSLIDYGIWTGLGAAAAAGLVLSGGALRLSEDLRRMVRPLVPGPLRARLNV